jgi:hypothetical protein
VLAEVSRVTTIHSASLTTWVSRNACAQLRVVHAWNSYVAAMDKCTKMNAHYENGPARTRFTSLSLIPDHVSDILDIWPWVQFSTRESILWDLHPESCAQFFLANYHSSECDESILPFLFRLGKERFSSTSLTIFLFHSSQVNRVQSTLFLPLTVPVRQIQFVSYKWRTSYVV